MIQVEIGQLLSWDRTSESRTVLMGLTMLDFYGNWSFENAAYYQMVMVGWLEKNKNAFINRILEMR